MKEKKEPSGLFYYWRGERPRDANSPQLEETGEVWPESPDRATGYFIHARGWRREAACAHGWRLLAR